MILGRRSNATRLAAATEHRWFPLLMRRGELQQVAFERLLLIDAACDLHTNAAADLDEFRSMTR
jgi:hypothetical protein